jgi:hypothetical protein
MLAAAADGPALRRFALVASANDGGAGRARLRFADSDAQAVATVLKHLGGVQAEDVVAIAGGTRPRLRQAFDVMKARLAAGRKPGVRSELFVYYSGHSDEDGLLLGGDRVAYPELRRWIEEAGADVRIAILDSCASGALVRLKGGAFRPSFLSDASTQARGHAYLTASSADEAAQESDRIGAAFFTHYLVSGLRGAADASRDGRVTLHEAYKFAYDETLRRTQASRAGAQHPNYDIQLAGTGDLVMTDLTTTSARLVLGDKLAGRLYVRDAAGRLLVELRKEPLYPVELGLLPGAYRVALDADGRPFEASVILTEGARHVVAMDAFRPVASLAVATRGGDAGLTAGAPELGVPPPGARVYRDVPFDLVLVPGARMSGGTDPVRHRVALGLVTTSDALSGLQLSLAGNIVRDEARGLQLTSGFNLIYGPGRGLQLANLSNLTMSTFHGAQVSGLVNYAAGDLRGVQLATVNVARGDVQGAQVSTVNVAKGEVRGAQIAVVNVGGRVRGAQVGVVNIADEVDGLQLGVVNVARRARGVSFGLVPIIGNGYNRVTAWSSDTSLANAGFKLGTPHFYVLGGLGAANDHTPGVDRPVAQHLGLGGHITPFGGRLFFDVDAVNTYLGRLDSRTFEESEARSLSSLRVAIGWQLARHFAVYGGPTVNVQVSGDGRDYRPGFGDLDTVLRDDTTTVRLFPGFVAGVQL